MQQVNNQIVHNFLSLSRTVDYFLSEHMDLFIAGQDQSAADQSNNLAEISPHCNYLAQHSIPTCQTKERRNKKVSALKSAKAKTLTGVHHVHSTTTVVQLSDSVKQQRLLHKLDGEPI